MEENPFWKLWISQNVEITPCRYFVRPSLQFLQLLLVWRAFYLLQKYRICWVGIRWCTWLQDIPFLYLVKTLRCFFSMFITIHQHCEASTNQFSESIALYASDFILLHLSAASSISQSSHQWPSSTGSFACLFHDTALAMPNRWWAMLRLMSFSLNKFLFPSLW